ncbi:MAG TPA: hypothetical protein VN687_03205 [Blastocatellia bacterium]|nr:hypothetical protein [Blastocatellia bacterium]
MNQDETKAEACLKQGISEGLLAFAGKIKQEQNWKSHLENAIRLYDEALSLGLSGEEEISCRINLTELLLYKLFSYAHETEVAPMLKTDLEHLPTVKKALTIADQALRLDAQAKSSQLKSERREQVRILPELDVLWRFHARYLKDTFGNERKLSYLQEKLMLLEYIDGLHLPGMCISLADYYYETQNPELALEWLQKCINAEYYSDVPGHRESPGYQLAEVSKQDAQKKLKFLRNKQQGPSISQQQEREKLIAKRRAAGECEICGTKLGFFEKAGGNVRCKTHK